MCDDYTPNMIRTPLKLSLQSILARMPTAKVIGVPQIYCGVVYWTPNEIAVELRKQ